MPGQYQTQPWNLELKTSSSNPNSYLKLGPWKSDRCRGFIPWIPSQALAKSVFPCRYRVSNRSQSLESEHQNGKTILYN